MQQDLKLIQRKLREAKKLPESNREEYNLKKDILTHWTFEKIKLKSQIVSDIQWREWLVSSKNSV